MTCVDNQRRSNKISQQKSAIMGCHVKYQHNKASLDTSMSFLSLEAFFRGNYIIKVLLKILLNQKERESFTSFVRASETAETTALQVARITLQ